MRGTLLRLFVLLALLAPGAAQAQTAGSLAGRVTHRQTGQPLSGAQIVVVGTRLGQITNDEGRFLILNVPAGTYAVTAQFIGFAEVRQNDIAVAPGQTATVNFTLAETVLTLNQLVVSGSSDPIAGIKAPFSIGKISRENLATVPTTSSALAAIQGKVAGASVIRGSGQPGTGVSILLRTPTSVQQSNDPLFVVDGVVLATAIGGTTVDLESLDIESVEVIKGAAAASLYGSRAAAGVVSITTTRGRDLNLDQTRIRVRSEFGTSEAPDPIPLSFSHHYLQNAQGQWVNAAGTVVARSQRVVKPDNIMDNPYLVPTYDNISRFFQPAAFSQHSVNLAHSAQSTNFMFSATRQRERGTLSTNDGFTRNTFRVNLDHRLRGDFSLALSAQHARTHRDLIVEGASGTGGIFWPLLMFPIDVDLSKKDAEGVYLILPDSSILVENPLFDEQTQEFGEWRARTLASVDARYSPFDWLNVSGQIAYDRSDRNEEYYRPKGLPTSITADVPTSGSLQKEYERGDVYNGSLTANLLRTFGDLTTRTTFRGTIEREDNEQIDADGSNFWVRDVPDLSVASERSIASSYTTTRSEGYYVEENLDFAGKYIGSFLIRRDGSSRFGPGNRWHTYYRAAGSWLISRERFWPFEQINDLKLRFSQGTAGNRPSFAAQYETWTVNASGGVTKATLGNRDLAPEHTTEREFGIDLIFLNNFQLELTYARQQTRDQIIQLALPAMYGYPNQWFNTGVTSGHTYEATLQAQLVNRPGLSWSTTLVADRSRSRIDEWNRACFFEDLTQYCDGASLFDVWGQRFYRSNADIAPLHPNAQDQFDVNDDGYLVWVGAGNSWRDGLSKGLWGTTGVVDGTTYNWGVRIVDRDSLGFPIEQKIGSTAPNLSLGWLNNVSWRGLALHTHFHGQIGGQVYNATKQRLYQHERHGDLDQSGKAPENKKTIEYYQALYNAANTSTHFLEPGGYLKLRSVSLQYRLNEPLLNRIGLGRIASGISLGLIGRNIFTISNYSGYDPEVGDVTERLDSFDYPNVRNYTATIEITF